MMDQKILFLSEQDVLRTGMLQPHNCNRVLTESFVLVGKEDFLLGGTSNSEHGIAVHFPTQSAVPNMPLCGPDYRYMAMVGYVGGDLHVCGSKIYGSNTENTSRGLPRSNHIIILNDVDTFLPRVILNGTQISNMRTGAVAGVGAKYLAPPHAKVCGLVGAGTVNRAALLCLADALPELECVYIYDRAAGKSEALAREMAGLHLKFRCVSSEAELLPYCDVVHYGTSAIEPLPVILPEKVKPGSLIEISSLVDYPESLLDGRHIVVDYLKMHEIWHTTDPELGIATYPVLDRIARGALRREDVGELGKIIAGVQKAPETGRETTLFMVNGMSVWDIALACSVFKAAKQQGIGSWLSL